MSAPSIGWISLIGGHATLFRARRLICPDAVFEIAFPSDTIENLRQKMRAYLANGAQVAVLVDPQTRRVEVCRPARDVDVHDAAEKVGLDPPLIGFTLNVASLVG